MFKVDDKKNEYLRNPDGQSQGIWNGRGGRGKGLSRSGGIIFAVLIFGCANEEEMIRKFLRNLFPFFLRSVVLQTLSNGLKVKEEEFRIFIVNSIPFIVRSDRPSFMKTQALVSGQIKYLGGVITTRHGK